MRKKRTRVNFSLAYTLCFYFLFAGISWAETSISILVNPGNLASIEEAGHAEEQVDWWDGDLSDDNACTESFAALELRHFLSGFYWG